MILSPPLRTYRFTSPYGDRVHPTLGDVRFHNGVDLAAPTGTPVYPAADGVVAYTGYTGINGNWIKVDHGGGWSTAYLHLSRILTTTGKQVSPNQVIGEVGATGRVSGPHLHFMVYRDGKPVDPMEYLGARAAEEEPSGEVLDDPSWLAYLPGPMRSWFRDGDAKSEPVVVNTGTWSTTVDAIGLRGPDGQTRGPGAVPAGRSAVTWKGAPVLEVEVVAGASYKAWVEGTKVAWTKVA